MRMHRSAVLIASLALAGCASARKPDVRLPATFEAPQAAASAPIALDRWWTVFGDDQLNGLVDSALAANPDAKTAAARLAEARATATSGLTRFLPQGDAAGSAKRTHTEQLSGTAINIPGFSTSGTSENYAANLNVSWEVDLFGRIFAVNRAAKGDVAAARFSYEGTRASLAAQVADAYFQARGLAIQLADARETVRIEEELYRIASKKAQVGLTAGSDADRVAGDLAQSRAQAEALAAELQAQRRTLLILAGRPIEPTASVNVPPNVGRMPPVPASVPSELLARRPDVREAQARVQSASGRLLLADLSFFPTFTLTPGVGWSKVVQPGYRSTTDSWTIGGSVSQPILSIPRLLADLKAQNARTEQAVLAYEKAVQTAFGEAENALVRLDADERRVTVLVEGERRAARAYEAARKGYSLGLTDLQTALSAEQSWRATRAQLTTAQVQGLRQSVTTFKALGGGWPAERYATQTK
ncbi:efflux transporter outer membrane subunit [Phenylobacterium soli]|uniref:TolC family protein n=1 Tax=Phenylobacterium soli TaxID=2170551 RepID=A0A328AI62_9CAUL|nr:TolC family protein [Phenylobacterium soli]RAK53074.1 TolC family protein [Phenylobacterium soli]